MLKMSSFGLFKPSLEEIALHVFLNDELKSIELLSNFVGVLMIPTPASENLFLINKMNLKISIMFLELKLLYLKTLLEPPFGDKYLGFFFTGKKRKSNGVVNFSNEFSKSNYRITMITFNKI